MSRKKTTKEFIDDAIKLHGIKYDYSLVEYKNNKTKVKIICPMHGVFEQRPDMHLRTGKKEANGCPECGKIKAGKHISNTKLKSIGEWKNFVEMKYPDFKFISCTSTDSNKGKSTIKCMKHSITFMTTNTSLKRKHKNHLCPVCRLLTHHKQNVNSVFTEIYVYYIYMPKFNMYKLGISLNPLKRFGRYKIELIWMHKLPVQDAIDFEDWIHNTYKDFRNKNKLEGISGGYSEFYEKDLFRNFKDIYTTYRDSIEKSIV